MGMIIGRSLTPFNPRQDIAGRPMVRRSDDNSRRKVQNVREDSSVLLLDRSAKGASHGTGTPHAVLTDDRRSSLRGWLRQERGRR
jgi:hypothetical protein